MHVYVFVGSFCWFMSFEAEGPCVGKDKQRSKCMLIMPAHEDGCVNEMLLLFAPLSVCLLSL